MNHSKLEQDFNIANSFPGHLSRASMNSKLHLTLRFSACQLLLNADPTYLITEDLRHEAHALKDFIFIGRRLRLMAIPPVAVLKIVHAEWENFLEL